MADRMQAALACLRARIPAVMVTVLAAEGSTPREAGALMIVTPTDTIGTVGGGNLEHIAIAQARALLELSAGEWRVQDYPLGPLLGQCCGGRVRVMLEHLDPDQAGWLERANEQLKRGESFALTTHFHEGRLSRTFADEGGAPSVRGPRPVVDDAMTETFVCDQPAVLLFGAGHVGTALHRLLATLPFRTQAFDTRSCLDGPEAPLPVTEAQAEHASRTAHAEALVLIMTHDHGLDYRLVLSALQGRARFVGLIGSATKRARFLGRLRQQGMRPEDLDRLCCPIGMPGVDGKQPEIIAVSVAAQLLMLRARVLAANLKGQPRSVDPRHLLTAAECAGHL